MEKQCSCPKCKAPSMSVSAMNYKETERWDKQGRFRGVGGGVGIGTGGVGLGVGLMGGSYSESGERRTKRADVYQEPQTATPKLPAAAIAGIVASLGGIFIYQFGLSFYTSINNQSSNTTPVDGFADKLIDMFTIVGPIIVVILVLWGFYHLVTGSKTAEKQADAYNNTVYPHLRKRYAELRYCESCHLLFDSDGNSAIADENGFNQMLHHGL